MSHADQVLAELAERMSGFPLIEAKPQRDLEPWEDPQVQDVLARAAHRAAQRRFTGEPPTGFGSLA